MFKLFYSKKTNSIYHLIHEFLNYTILQPFFSSHEHIHPVYHLVFILSGKGFIESSYGAHTLSPGQIIIINPNEKHIFSTQDETLKYYAVNFCLQQVDSKFNKKAMEIIPLQEILDIDVDRVYVNYHTIIWEKIKREIDVNHSNFTEYNNSLVLASTNYTESEELSEYAFDFVCHMYTKYLCRNLKYENQQHHNNPLIIKIISYLESHLGEHLVMSNLAEELGYNASYLSRFFKSQTSLSISEYLLRLKIHKSCNLIRMTQKSITEIALELGFSSSQHFCRTFKSMKNVSPGQFRKNLELS